MAYPYGGQPGYGAPQGGYPGQQPGYGAPIGGPPPGMDPTVYQWFIAVDQDKSGKITAAELQQALTNGNWSHFNPETCRLMIGMFDRDFSGTIDVNEFQTLWTYIQQWKQVFDQFDRDRSGAIEGNELHNAFNTMGYRVTPQFAQLVVMRFDIHARRSMTLDNFIQASILLKSVTDSFRQRDTQAQGMARMNYEDFMTTCLLNKP